MIRIRDYESRDRHAARLDMACALRRAVLVADGQLTAVARARLDASSSCRFARSAGAVAVHLATGGHVSPPRSPTTTGTRGESSTLAGVAGQYNSCASFAGIWTTHGRWQKSLCAPATSRTRACVD